MISIIVAIAEGGVIGHNNDLLWHISEDMRYFRRVTSSHTVIMGRKTYDSIGRPLPKRRNIVISHQAITIEGCEVVHSLDEALASLTATDDEVFVIGGAQIYNLALPLADRLYITRVGGNYKGETLFPKWNESDWKLISSEEHERGEEYPHRFAFEVYERL